MNIGLLSNLINVSCSCCFTEINENLPIRDNATGRRLSYSVHHHFDNMVYHIAHSMEQDGQTACKLITLISYS